MGSYRRNEVAITHLDLSKKTSLAYTRFGCTCKKFSAAQTPSPDKDPVSPFRKSAIIQSVGSRRCVESQINSRKISPYGCLFNYRRRSAPLTMSELDKGCLLMVDGAARADP